MTRIAPHALLFVHSPLVGPSSLRRLADAAARAGHRVALPDLTSTIGADDPHGAYRSIAVEAARTLRAAPIVVGHSGAGAFLPAIGHAVRDCAGLVFIDAVLPPVGGSHHTSDDVASLLDSQTVDGLLRPWLDWWPAEALDAILPNPVDRTELAADIPRVARAFYDVDVAVPDGWSAGRCGYVRLSHAYDDELAEAVRRGWVTASLDSTHLGTLTEPARVLETLTAVVERLG